MVLKFKIQKLFAAEMPFYFTILRDPMAWDYTNASQLFLNGKETEDFVTSDDSKSDIQLKDQIHLNNTMMCDFRLRSDQSVNISTIKQKIKGWLHTLNMSFFNTRRRCFLTFHDFLYFQKLRPHLDW